MKVSTTFIIFLFSALLCGAQTNYYTETKTFYENGYTYQCDCTGEITIELYNKANKWTHVSQMIKGTNKPYYRKEGEYAPPCTSEFYCKMNTATKKIINDVFSAYKEQLKGRTLIFTTCINSDTGKVDESYFTFVNRGLSFAGIPVSVFRKA